MEAQYGNSSLPDILGGGGGGGGGQVTRIMLTVSDQLKENGGIEFQVESNEMAEADKGGGRDEGGLGNRGLEV